MQATFGTDRFRVYTNADLVGVELAGALKNVIGIAAGICDGLGFGDNAKAALLTRGLVEMTRFGVAHGADPATFAGLAGIGDLITTCFSPHGRNRRVGERLAKGESLAAVTRRADGGRGRLHQPERLRPHGPDGHRDADHGRRCTTCCTGAGRRSTRCNPSWPGRRSGERSRMTALDPPVAFKEWAAVCRALAAGGSR